LNKQDKSIFFFMINDSPISTSVHLEKEGSSSLEVENHRPKGWKFDCGRQSWSRKTRS